MDQAPRPEIPEELEIEQQLKRKKRFLDRFRGLGDGREVEVDLTDVKEDKEGGLFGEFWSRDEEALTPDEILDPVEVDSSVERAQHLGRSVLEQSWAVHGFAESLSETVDSLPTASREAVKPEADRLQSAAGELHEAAEELDEELEGLDQVGAESVETSVERPEPVVAAPTAPEKVKPKRDMSESLGMARLVIATLIGGGLGVLVGEGRKKERARASMAEKAKADKIIEQQKVKIAEQDAELQKLQASKPEVGVEPKKEFIKKTSELTERQVELTHSTVEQVKVAAQQAAEAERTFKIPEQQKPEAKKTDQEHLADKERTERVEKLPEQPNERQDQRSEQPAHQSGSSHSVFDYNKSTYQPPIYQQPKPKFGISSPRAWTYGIWLAVAVAIALGLLLFGR